MTTVKQKEQQKQNQMEIKEIKKTNNSKGIQYKTRQGKKQIMLQKYNSNIGKII